MPERREHPDGDGKGVGNAGGAWDDIEVPA